MEFMECNYNKSLTCIVYLSTKLKLCNFKDELDESFKSLIILLAIFKSGNWSSLPSVGTWLTNHHIMLVMLMPDLF